LASFRVHCIHVHRHCLQDQDVASKRCQRQVERLLAEPGRRDRVWIIHLTVLCIGVANAGVNGPGVRATGVSLSVCLYSRSPSRRALWATSQHGAETRSCPGISAIPPDERPILVDDLVGTGHRSYGALPNMTYILGRGGRVLFRSDWTDAPMIAMYVQYLLEVRQRRRSGARLAGFFTECMGYRNVDPVQFQHGLERAGPQAVEDVARTMQRWTSQGKIPSRMEE
jgi:hypothetical protein